MKGRSHRGEGTPDPSSRNGLKKNSNHGLRRTEKKGVQRTGVTKGSRVESCRTRRFVTPQIQDLDLGERRSTYMTGVGGLRLLGRKRNSIGSCHSTESSGRRRYGSSGLLANLLGDVIKIGCGRGNRRWFSLVGMEGGRTRREREEARSSVVKYCRRVVPR